MRTVFATFSMLGLLCVASVADAPPAKQRSPALKALLREMDQADRQASQMPLALRKRIYFDITQADHAATIASGRAKSPLEGARIQRDARERGEARLCRRYHISPAILTAIAAQGYQAHWPKAPGSLAGPLPGGRRPEFA